MSARRYLSSSTLPLVAALPPIRGRWFYIDPKDGSDANDGLRPENALLTLSAAYTKCTDGAGDGIALFAVRASSTDYSTRITTAITWSKSNITVFGICNGSGYSPRARIANTSTVLTLPNLITITGHANRFENVQIFNGGTDAAAVGCVTITGTRNVFKHCHIVGGSCTTATADEYSVQLGSGAQENDFVDCIIGTDTLARGNNANCELYVNGDSTTFRNRFIRTQFVSQGTAGGAHVAIKSGSGTSWNGNMVFNDCDFVSFVLNKGADVASVFGGTANTVCKIFMDTGCTMMGYAAWDSGSANTVYSCAPAGAATGGIAAAG